MRNRLIFFFYCTPEQSSVDCLYYCPLQLLRQTLDTTAAFPRKSTLDLSHQRD